jgi:hypothetical protein
MSNEIDDTKATTSDAEVVQASGINSLSEGDCVEVRGREYIVEEVVSPDLVDRVLSYSLTPVGEEDTPSRLEPVHTSDNEVAVISECHTVMEGDMEVLEKEDSGATQQ